MKVPEMEDLISTAIAERRMIAFRFRGLPRVGEPHLLGEHGGVMQLLVYQTAGFSNSGPLPQWRRLNLNDIRELRLLPDTFGGPRTDSYHGWTRVVARVR